MFDRNFRDAEMSRVWVGIKSREVNYFGVKTSVIMNSNFRFFRKLSEKSTTADTLEQFRTNFLYGGTSTFFLSMAKKRIFLVKNIFKTFCGTPVRWGTPFAQHCSRGYQWRYQKYKKKAVKMFFQWSFVLTWIQARFKMKNFSSLRPILGSFRVNHS